MFRLERHPLGPRVYVAGCRVHEWHLGLALLVILGAGALLQWWDLTAVTASLSLAGFWLLAKDWRDVLPRTRDTVAWRLGLHRAPAPLRAVRRGDWVPPLAAAATTLVAVVSLASTFRPGLSLHGLALLRIEPIAAIPVLHGLVLPAAAGLVIASFYLLRRRRRAWQLAVGVLLGLGVLSLLRGRQVDEAALAFAAAALLVWGRDSFYVRQEPVSLGSAIWRVPLLGLAAAGLAGVTVWAAASPHPGVTAAARETLDLLLWSRGPLALGDEFSWVPFGVGAVSLSAALAAAYLLFRPLAAPRGLPDARVRHLAAELVHAHGTDTLSFFKLRADEQYLFSPDGRAFIGYRVEGGVLLLAGDPVGPPDAVPGLIREVCALAELRGLAIGGIGAGASLLPLWAQAGVKSLYLGDEAIVETGAFSLEGRAVRKVRQSVSRLEVAGYRAELHDLGSLDEATLESLEAVAARWRAGVPERGFSMAMDSLRGEHLEESTVVLARDAAGQVRGFLHFVPVSRRPAVSLSSMRRDRDTPNGLMEFLVARSVEFLRARGVEEISLNFAAFARLMHNPRTRAERLLGRLLALANPHFQIESLYRFNAKFFPRWEPRYLLYERTLALPRIGLAALWAEGQLPKPRRRATALAPVGA